MRLLTRDGNAYNVYMYSISGDGHGNDTLDMYKISTDMSNEYEGTRARQHFDSVVLYSRNRYKCKKLASLGTQRVHAARRLGLAAGDTWSCALGVPNCLPLANVQRRLENSA